MLFNEKTVKVLGKLHKSFEKQEVNPDEEYNRPVISSIGDIVGNMKFVHGVSQTGKLSLQFIDFILFTKIFVCDERTGNLELHVSSLKQILLYLAAAGHDKYTVPIPKYL